MITDHVTSLSNRIFHIGILNFIYLIEWCLNLPLSTFLRDKKEGKTQFVKKRLDLDTILKHILS